MLLEIESILDFIELSDISYFTGTCKVFDEVKEKLANFTASDEYDAFLKNTVNKIYNYFFRKMH